MSYWIGCRYSSSSMWPVSAGLLLRLATFVAFGAAFGSWQVLLPDLSRDVAPSPGALGAAISIGFVGSLPVMLFGGRLVDRFGTRRIGVVAGVTFGGAEAALALTGSYVALLVVLAVFYAASGAYDVAINAAAIDWEAARRRRVMTLVHAGFSGGAMVGALVTGAALAVGAPYRALYVAAGGVVWLVMLTWWVGAGRDAPHRQTQVATAPSIWRDHLLIGLGVAAALAFIIEGAMESWSAIYLRTALGLPAVVGASGIALFHGAMLTGRIGSLGTQRLLGRRGALRIGGAMAAVGMVFALLTEIPALVVIGFGVVGLAVSAAAPVALSLAGEARPGQSGQASSAVTVIGYSGFLVGPAIVGGVAQVTDLRLALGLVVIAAIGIGGIGQWLVRGVSR
jgi:MFS family permease